MALCRQPDIMPLDADAEGFSTAGEGLVSFSANSSLLPPPGSTPPTSLLRKRSSESLSVRIPTNATRMDPSSSDHSHHHEGSCSSSSTSSSYASSCRPLSPPMSSLSTSPPRSTGSTSSTLSSSQSASHIRSKFLYKLGIDSKNVIDGPTRTNSNTNDTRSSRPRSGSFQESLKADYGLPAVNSKPMQRVVEENNSSDSEDCGSATSATSATLSTSWSSSTCNMRGMDDTQQQRRQPRSVSFDAAVTVHPIPRRSEYSNRIRSSLWTPVAELQENAARNCVEFAAENWDWRQAANDDDMVIYQGEKIHPVHFMMQEQQYQNHYAVSPPTSPTKSGTTHQQDQEFSLRRMLFAVLSAQQEE